ncbi:tripartite tricarboxylate transporter TctB family protein [Oceanicella sp. SM1341]|uniref:tripartite tricarboxylate transporter TctB family protein n=1 Tax=Oceanicella sp. SM1341 TaxID=1548889 RepID=UPI000E4E98D6|nr:tripartite tricarboxylate transporter TctB family protein [Oceanicella sp. SM1341]
MTDAPDTAPPAAPGRAAKLGFTALFAVLGLAALVAGSEIPPAVYEPVGSRAFPLALGALALGLAAAQAALLLPGLLRGRPAERDEPAAELWPAEARAAAAFALTVLWIGLVALTPLPFAPGTALYMLAMLAFLLRRCDARFLALAVPVSAGFAWGLTLLFTRVFYLSL